MRSSRRARLAATAASAAWLACAGPPTPHDEPAPRPLVASQEMPGDFLLQQQLRFRWQGGEGSLDAAVQSACGELTIVLLTPMGTRGVTIRQRGWDVAIEGRTSDLPFAPERILLDVQRTYLAPPANPPRVGTVERRIGEQRIEETFADGRLTERVFQPTREGDDRVRIRYGLETASLESERYGYRLDVTTLARQPVACGVR